MHFDVKMLEICWFYATSDYVKDLVVLSSLLSKFKLCFYSFVGKEITNTVEYSGLHGV